MYYDQGCTQAEIATQLGVSRSTISRALQRAQDEGVVEIRLTVRPPEVAQLESELLAADHHLQEVMIAPLREAEHPRAATARVTARILESLFSGGDTTVAIGWGRTLAAAAALARHRPARRGRLVDAIGHAHSAEGAAAMDVSSTLATAFSISAVHVPAPALVRDADTARVLLSEESVRRALELARGADATVVSIGSTGPGTPLLATDLLVPTELDELVGDGAVGDILGCFVDAAGAPVPRRDLFWIGLTAADLLAARHVIAVAGGPGKESAVRAVLSSGMVDALVTDEATARALLAHG